VVSVEVVVLAAAAAFLDGERRARADDALRRLD
jgi:hypothetical protein